MDTKRRTEDEFLHWREHVERECHFILIAFALEPAEEGGSVKHYDGGPGRPDYLTPKLVSDMDDLSIAF